MTRVVVEQGELQGKLEKLSSGNTFTSFKGIPYASPPVGKLRNPTPITDDLIEVEWKPVTKICLNFLDIGFELTPGQDPDKERFELWMNIFNSVYNKKSVF